MASRDQSTPYFDDWIPPCQGNLTDVTYHDYPMHDDAEGVEIPTWAYIGLANDTSFDIVSAAKSKSLLPPRVKSNCVDPLTRGERMDDSRNSRPDTCGCLDVDVIRHIILLLPPEDKEHIR